MQSNSCTAKEHDSCHRHVFRDRTIYISKNKLTAGAVVLKRKIRAITQKENKKEIFMSMLLLMQAICQIQNQLAHC